MKKILFIMLLYVLVEGDNIIGDGLYVYHRGKHAVDELATKVNEYYPRIHAIDTTLYEALPREVYIEPPDTLAQEHYVRGRRVISW